jgi:release factor glutamine methyltransferase
LWAQGIGYFKVRETRTFVKGGWLFCEIHEDYGKEVEALFLQENFTGICVVKDLFDKERMVCGRKG